MPFEKFEEMVRPPEEEIKEMEEKIETIKDFFQSSYELETERATREFERMSPSEIREFLGEDFESIWRLITIQKEAKEELKELKEEDLSFLKEKEMLPKRFTTLTSDLPETLVSYIELKLILKTLPEKERKRWEKLIEWFRGRFTAIEKCIFPEREEKEELTLKFEKFPLLSQKESGDFFKEALSLLPEKVLGKNIKKIVYVERVQPASPKYGFEGFTAASYNSEEALIEFYKPPTPSKIRPGEFLGNLAHECGHALDPRFIPQESLSIKEEIEMCKEWEMVRKKEPEFSAFVCAINSEDKKEEDFLKSTESFAETISLFLTYPEVLERTCPVRFEFCKKWLGKQFPEEGFTEAEILEDGSKRYLRIWNLRKKLGI